MNPGINLIIDKRDRTKKIKRATVLQKSAFGLLFLILVVSVSLLLLNIGSVIESLRLERSRLISQLTASVEKEQKYAFVANRLKEIEKIIGKRVDYEAYISLIQTQIPSSIEIKSIDVSKNALEVSFSSNSLIVLSEALDNFLKLGQTDKRFSNVVVKDMSLNTKEGRYTLSLSVSAL